MCGVCCVWVVVVVVCCLSFGVCCSLCVSCLLMRVVCGLPLFDVSVFRVRCSLFVVCYVLCVVCC